MSKDICALNPWEGERLSRHIEPRCSNHRHMHMDTANMMESISAGYYTSASRKRFVVREPQMWRVVNGVWQMVSIQRRGGGRQFARQARTKFPQLPQGRSGPIKSLELVLAVVLAFSLNSWAGQVTGTVQSGGGVPLVGASITFTPTSPAVSVGSFLQTSASIPCATDVAGSVVGVADPAVAATVASAGGGSLAGATTYYVQYTYTMAGGLETAPSPELAFSLAGGSSALFFTAPVLQPSNANGWKIYVSLVSGQEKLQATITGFGNSTITSLLSVTSVPGSNNTTCVFTFSDSLIPQVLFTLNIIDSNGSQVPGWPQKYYMQGAVFNLNTAFPTANMNVIFPNAIVASPSSNHLQVINGPLTLNGFGFTGLFMCLSGDSGLTRQSAAIFNIGTCTPGDASGTLNLATLNLTTLALGSLGVVKWSTDTGFSRNQAGIIAVGNGTQGDTSGIVLAARFTTAASAPNLGTNGDLTIARGSSVAYIFMGSDGAKAFGRNGNTLDAFGFNSLTLYGSSSGNTIIQTTAVASGTLTIPALTGTFATINNPQTWSGNQTNMTLVTPLLASPTINTAFGCGTGHKAASVTTGSLGGVSRNFVTLTWCGSVFADTAYVPVCSVVETTAGAGLSLRIEHIDQVNTGSVRVVVLNDAAGALTGTLMCMADHP